MAGCDKWNRIKRQPGGKKQPQGLPAFSVPERLLHRCRRDVPAPCCFPPSHRTNRSRYDLSEPGVWQRVGRTHHTKTDIAVTEAGIVPEPDRGARMVRIIEPGAAAQHTRFVAGASHSLTTTSSCKDSIREKFFRRGAAVQWNSKSVISVQHRRAQRTMGDEHTTRKPRKSLR